MSITQPPSPVLAPHDLAGLYTRHSGRVTRTRVALLCMDLLVVGLLHLLALSVGEPRDAWHASLGSLALSLIALPIILYLNGAYGLAWAQSAVKMCRSVLRAVPEYGVLLLLSVLLLPQLHLTAANALLVIVAAGAGVALNRVLLFSALRNARGSHSMLIVGAGWSGRAICQALAESGVGQFRVVGFVDDDPNKLGKDILPECSVIGTTSELTRLIIEYQVSELVLAITEQVPARLYTILAACQQQGVQTVAMANLYEEISGRVPVKHIDDRWFLYCFSPESQRFYEAMKRVIDIAGALVGLVALAAIFPVIALAICLDSRGPILYRQVRVGKGERPFTILKFRTMVKNAEANGAVWASENDSRVTRVGNWLRVTRIDELPQLWNVLKGEMGLIGPRPERPEFVKQLSREIPFYQRRHAVLPGITGWAQVKYPYGASVEDALQKLQYDLYYIKHRSLFLDFVIVVKTLATMVGRRGR